MFFDLLFGENRSLDRSIRDYNLDYPLKHKLCLTFFVLPLVRCGIALLIGTVLFMHVVNNPRKTNITIDIVTADDIVWKTVRITTTFPVDYRVFAIFLHLTLILPLAAFNARAGYKLNSMSKWQMPLALLERHFLYVIMWACYSAIGVSLTFFFSLKLPLIIATLIPELFLDIFGFLYTVRLMRPVNQLREISVAAGRPAPVFSLDSDLFYVLCNNGIDLVCCKERAGDRLRV